ncbi:choice-of-anchor J domain-containing protein [bacterium]|nr:choice-of-anchor J domain-containing protein [bacterium]
MISRTVFMLALMLIGGVVSAIGAPPQAGHHALAAIYPDTKLQLEKLGSITQFDFIPGRSRADIWIAASAQDIEFLQELGYRYEILIDDMEAFYADRARSEGSLDDMGGYKTLSEIVAELDQIHADHPAITSAKFSIGLSLEGNDIWCMKISDNPEIDEDEIELLFTSLTHAREPAGMELLFVFFDYLTNNYSPGSGNESTELIDNREFYWIPCVNPDGYLYNELTNPDGGGMWRKNRRNNGGSYGVDLNRNYGFNWGYDDGGSSPIPSEEDYRGPSAFSEPETQAYRDFVESRDFLVAMNYHTYQNLVLYPWGVEEYEGGLTEEDSLFSLMADSMAYYIFQVNGASYGTGTAWQTLYSVNGDANDWCYGEQTTKDRIFAFTTEVGGASDGFWPAPSRIMPLALENLPANLFVSRYAEQLVPPDQWVQLRAADFSEQSGDADGIVESGETLRLDVTLRNSGLLDLTSLTGTITTNSPFATIINGNVSWPDLEPNEEAAGLSYFSAEIAPGIPEPFGVEFELHFTAVSGLDTTINVMAIIGPPVLAEDFESGAPEWTHQTPGGQWVDQWHLSTENYHSGTSAYKCGDTGSGNHANLLDAQLLSPVISNLPEQATLSFWGWMNAERSGLYPDSAYDGGVVEISVDGGAFEDIAPVDGYSHTFRGTSTGPIPGRACWSGTPPWREYTFDLSAFANQDVRFRFRFGSDESVTNEGWYVDDVVVEGIRTVDVFTPSGLTIAAVANDIHLHWESDLNAFYRIYSDTDSEGSFETFEGSTTDTSFVIPDGVLSNEIKFFIIMGSVSE